MNYNRSFYKETGYKTTDEPLGQKGYSKTISKLLEYFGPAVQYGSARSFISKLKKLVEQYPNVPEFKNYLYVAYKRSRKNRSARKLLEKTVEEHPDYLFGRSGLAEIYIEKKKFEQAVEVMGGYPFDIKNIIKDRELYHYSEFLTFYTMAATYELDQGNAEEAERMHKMMYLLDPEHLTTKTMAKRIMANRLSSGLNRLQSIQKKAISVKSFPTVKYEAKKNAPTFHHEEIHALYQNPANDLPLAIQEQLLALPRQTLVEDLEAVIKDSIHRFDYFYKNYKEWNEAEQSFIVHALYLLAHLEAEDSLPVVLDMLRQGEKFLDYWFSDSFNDLTSIPMFMLGKNRLNTLQQYVLEPNQSYQARMAISQTVTQVIWHYPERRAEAVDWFKHVFHHLLENPTDKTILDTDFIAFTIMELMDARVVELEAEVTALYEKGWISDIHAGNLTEISKSFHSEPDPHYRLELPRNLNEFYTKEYLARKPAPVLTEEDEIFLKEDPYQDYLSETFFSDMPTPHEEQKSNDDFDDLDFFEPVHEVETFKRKDKKVGRNDPCPCGSGKKYKKCCGKP